MWNALAVLMIVSFATTVRAAPSASSPPISNQAGAALESEPFATGSRYRSATAGASLDATLGWIYLTQISVSYYVADNLAMTYGGIVGYANVKRERGGMLGGPELGVRWHVAHGKRWSTYLEGLVGEVVQQNPLTPDTLRFNFDLQPGVGATYRLNNTLLYQGGLRWHHLSNAQVRGRAHNFGYDGPMLYFGLAQSF